MIINRNTLIVLEIIDMDLFFIITLLLFFSPVPGPFPLLLHLPNGQTMPVAIPASITSSNVHVPTAVPVSLKFRLFKSFLYYKLIFVIRKYTWGCLISFMKGNPMKYLLVVSIYSLIFFVIAFTFQGRHNW